MKSLLALALGLLCLGFAACGGSSKTEGAPASANSQVSPPSGTATHVDTTSPAVASNVEPRVIGSTPTRHDLEKNDRDEDDYTKVPDDHNPSPAGYVAAGPADARAITALVKRYYAVALAGDGAKGCSMFTPTFVQAIPLDYGKLGPVYLRRAAGTCPAVMSLLFRHEHHKLSGEIPRMQVVRVSVHGTQGVAFLRFGRLHERSISELREGRKWRIASVLDGELE